MKSCFLAGAIFLFLFTTICPGGLMTEIRYQTADLGSGIWQYTYEVTNISLTSALETEATLVDQPERTELEYRVIAINKAGDGLPSNTVMAVL